MRTPSIAVTSEGVVPVPLNRRTGTAAGMAGGRAARACELRDDPQPVKAIGARSEAITRIGHEDMATRLRKKCTRGASNNSVLTGRFGQPVADSLSVILFAALVAGVTGRFSSPRPKEVKDGQEWVVWSV